MWSTWDIDDEMGGSTTGCEKHISHQFRNAKAQLHARINQDIKDNAILAKFRKLLADAKDAQSPAPLLDAFKDSPRIFLQELEELLTMKKASKNIEERYKVQKDVLLEVLKTDNMLERIYETFCTTLSNRNRYKNMLRQIATAGLQGHPDQQKLLTGIFLAKGAFPIMCKLGILWGCNVSDIFTGADVETQAAILAQSPENLKAVKYLLSDTLRDPKILEPAINHLKKNNLGILQSHYKALGLDQNGQKLYPPSPSILT